MSGSIKPAVLHFLVSQNCFKTPCYQTLPLYIISSNAAIWEFWFMAALIFIFHWLYWYCFIGYKTPLQVEFYLVNNLNCFRRQKPNLLLIKACLSKWAQENWSFETIFWDICFRKKTIIDIPNKFISKQPLKQPQKVIGTRFATI